MIGKFEVSLIVTTFIACYGSSFLIGYNLSVTNIPQEHIKKLLRIHLLHLDAPNPNVTIKDSRQEFAFSFVNGIYVIGATIGAFCCGLVADFIGRRNGLIFNDIFGIIGAAFVAPLVYYNQPWLLYVGRFLSGINSGISMGVAVMFIVEIAPRRLRGAFGVCHQLAITIGIAVGYLTSLSFMLGTEKYWPIAISLGMVPALISLIVLPFCPESPRFLYLKRGKLDEAKAAFVRFNKIENVDTFFGELREEIEVAKNQPEFKFTQLFTQSDLKMPVIIACLIQVLQQLSGINAIITYSTIMFDRAGVKSDWNEICVLANGIVNIVVTISSVPLIERAGRRPLLLCPSVILATSLVLLTTIVPLSEKFEKTPTGTALAGTAVFLVFLFTIGFASGLGPLPSLIVGEIFRQTPRAAAYSLSQGIHWTCNLMVMFTFPYMDRIFGGFVFLPFAVVVVTCLIFFFFFMPETKNRTFDEVARDLAFGNIVVGKRVAQLQDKEMDVFIKDPNESSNRSRFNSNNDKPTIL